MREWGRWQTCETIGEERSAVTPHATICEGWRAKALHLLDPWAIGNGH
jgi:hypothetical protein